MTTLDEAYRQLLTIMPGKTFSLGVKVWRYVHPQAGGGMVEEVEVAYQLFIPDEKASVEDARLDNLVTRALQLHAATAGGWPLQKPLGDAFEAADRLPPQGRSERCP